MARSAERRVRDLLLRLLLGWAIVQGLGCAAIEHAYEAGSYAGRPLSARGAEGTHRLEAEARLDPTLRAYLEEKGRPDFLYVVSRSELYFFYLERDRAVRFKRDLAHSEVSELGRIPSHLLDMLPAAPRQRVVAQREEEKRRNRARVRRPAAASPAPPAARSSTGDVFLVGFDVKEIVDRMRPPLTAADAGVSGWRRSERPDGTARWTARMRKTRYEVRNDRVAMTTEIPRRGKRMPAAARLAVTRINTAIFGTRAGPVNDKTLELAASVARDVSGRTHYARRIAGRTIRISRQPRQGLLVYTVEP